MIDSLCENVYKMTIKWNEEHFIRENPEIVMLCTPKTYCEIRKEMSDRIQYERELREYGIPILTIIGIRVPVVIRNDMPKNVEYQLMFRKDYERLEQEEMYKKLLAMFD